jgi:hypothetical protein
MPASLALTVTLTRFFDTARRRRVEIPAVSDLTFSRDFADNLGQHAA